jgi:hypothetical protein
MKFIKKWFLKKKQEKCFMDFRAGFSWVMCEFFIGGKSIPELQSYIDCAYDFNELTAFDDGAIQALKILKDLAHPATAYALEA